VKFYRSVLLILCLSLPACTSEYNLATRRQETLLYSSDKETRMGERMAAGIEKQFKIIEDVDVNERVEKILDRIVAVCDRKDILYFIKVLDEEDINAVSLPGGYVYVFKGLIDKVKSDDQLAGVIAHEVGHINARHAVKRLQASYGAILLQALSIETESADVAAGVGLAINSMFSEYSQQDEFQADDLGVKYMKKAGFDPNAMVEFLEILRLEQEKAPVRSYSYWRTHPHLSMRIAVINKAIKGEMGFKDYLNIIQADDPVK